MRNAFSCLFRHFDKASIITSMIVSFSIAFVMGLINPFEIMLVNSQDFSVSYSDAFRCLLIPALLCFLAVLFVLFIALMIHRSVFEILRSVFLGVMVSSYCQELFLNGKMIVGDNGTTIAELSDTEVSINFFIHFAIIAFCVIMSARKFIPSREPAPAQTVAPAQNAEGDRKSTRLNSSHTDSSRMPSSA